ncbi:MAG: HEPN domain-containing protein [Defluviitaleaceae bacterium]|nr:HEPN domain-containing protein [Defluviitaleaceae bacterium]
MEFEYVAEWFKYADMDFITAEHLLTLYPQPLEIICFHCQQSAEKYLKGYLLSKGEIEPPRTHDLVLLQLACAESDSSFALIKRACEVLTRYGVQPRYPNEMEITENDMKKAIEYIRQIRELEPLAILRSKAD